MTANGEKLSRLPQHAASAHEPFGSELNFGYEPFGSQLTLGMSRTAHTAGISV
jgi:hypothetical protein